MQRMTKNMMHELGRIMIILIHMLHRYVSVAILKLSRDWAAHLYEANAESKLERDKTMEKLERSTALGRIT